MVAMLMPLEFQPWGRLVHLMTPPTPQSMGTVGVAEEGCGRENIDQARLSPALA